MNKKSISAKRIISYILTVTTLLLSITWVPAFAETEVSTTYTLYENTFDNGKNGLKAASEDGYAFENRFLIYDGVMGIFSDIETTTYIPSGETAENTAIRVGSGDWASGKTFLFDFTKAGVQEGIRSGIVRASFDFAFDAASTANAVRIGMNMTGDDRTVHEGGRMMYFVREEDADSNVSFKYQLAPSVGGWPGSSISGVVDTEAQHSLEIVMDFDEDTAIFYLDGAALKADGEVLVQSLTGKVMDNFMVALGGIFKYFDNFKVTHEFRKPLECVIDSEMDEQHPGNVFFDDEQIVLNLNVRNRDEVEYSDVPVLVTATDLNDNTVETKTVNVSVAAFGETDFQVGLDLPRFGAYKLSVTSDLSLTSTARVSRSVGNTDNNPKVNVHMQVNGGRAKDTVKVFELMDKAGLGGVRTDMGWLAVLNEDGSVTHSTAGDAYIEAAVEESKRTGVDILALLTTKNQPEVYPNDEDVGFNTSDAYLQGFYEYCKTVAEKFGEHIKWWELGNEDNYRRRVVGYDADGNEITEPDLGENYAKILLKGYQGIKDGCEDSIVLNSGSAVVLENDINNQYQFAKGWLGVAQADSANKYFDRFAVHSYHTGMMPEVRDRWNYNSDWEGYMSWVDKETFLKSHVLEPYGFEKVPTWVTETGYYVGTAYGDNRTEEIAAAYNLRLLLLNEINGFHEKIFFYNFANEGFDLSDSEDNYGMICRWTNEEWETRSAYAAKPQYLAVAQWNKLMNGAKYVSCERNVDYSDSEFNSNTIIKAPKDCYNAKFTSGDDIINVIWDVFDNSDAVTVKNTDNKKYIVMYDMYGNVTNILQNAKSVVYDPTKIPVYMVFTDELPQEAGWTAEPEIMFYRDYENYTGGNDNQTDAGCLGNVYNTYGTFKFHFDNDWGWETTTAETGSTGTGFKPAQANPDYGTIWKKSMPEHIRSAKDGKIYISFTSEAIDGVERTGRTAVGGGDGGYRYFGFKHGESYDIGRYHNSAMSYELPESIKNEDLYHIELIFDLETKIQDTVVNGVNISSTKWNTNIDMNSYLTLYFENGVIIDNLTMIYYPEKLVRQTFSIASATVNTDNTISVFLKSDAVDSDGKGADTKSAITAPFGISLLSANSESYTLSSDTFSVDGLTVTGVTRGVIPGEYVIAVEETLSQEDTYFVSVKQDITDVLGDAASADGVTAVAGKQEFAVTSVVTDGAKATATYTNATNLNKNFELMLAAYDRNGVIKELVTKQITAVRCLVDGTAEISLEQDIQDRTVKVFVWDSILNLKPVVY